MTVLLPSSRWVWSTSTQGACAPVRAAPDGVARAGGGQPGRLAGQRRAQRPPQRVVAGRGGLPVGVGRCGRPEAKATRRIRRRVIAKRDALVERVRAGDRQRGERRIVGDARGIRAAPDGAAFMRTVARVGVGVVGRAWIAIGIVGRRCADLPAQRKAVPSVATTGVLVAGRRLAQRQAALLASGVGRAIVADLTTRKVDGVAAIAGVAICREIEQVGPVALVLVAVMASFWM